MNTAGIPKIRWTPAEDEILRRLWVTPGVSRRQVAEAIGRTEKATKARAEQLRLPMGAPTVAMADWPAEMLDEFRRLAPTGIGKKQIARTLGVSYSQVRNASRRYGIPVKDGSNAHLTKKPGEGRRLRKGRTWAPSAESRERSRREAAQRRREAGDQEVLKIRCIPVPDHQEPRGCRWIDGAGSDWRYCQATPTKPGSSWCRHHHRIVFVQPEVIAEAA